MKYLFTFCAFLVFSFIFTPHLFAEQTLSSAVTNNEILIKLKNGKTINDILTQKNTQFIKTQFSYIADQLRTTANTKRALSNYVVYRHSSTIINDIITILKNNAAIEYVEPNFLFQTAALPNDPKYSQQYYLTKIKAPEAWTTTTGSLSVIVAVLDTGVDSNHPDIAANIWHDSNGNAGYNYGDNNYDTSDVLGHGTHVSGVIGAVGNNSIGITGINWNVQIMPVRLVGQKSVLAASTVAAGIMYAADHGANVINMSFGAPYIHSQVVTDAVEYAWRKNVILVASAGNKVLEICPIWFPANLEHVIAAGGTDQYDRHPDYSCIGSALDIVTPGSNIISIDRNGAYTTGISNTGTSYSSAMVSGAAALVLAAHPGMNNQAVVNNLESTADDLGTRGFDPIFGFGRLNLARALTQSMLTPQVTGAAPTASPTPTIRYVTPTINPYATPTVLARRLSIHTNIDIKSFVMIGSTVTVCYTVPHSGRVAFTAVDRTYKTYSSYYDTGAGNCINIVVSSPTGGHIFQVSMDGQSAETGITVIPNCTDCILKAKP